MKLKELRYIVSSTQMTKLLDMKVVGKLKTPTFLQLMAVMSTITISYTKNVVRYDKPTCLPTVTFAAKIKL